MPRKKPKKKIVANSSTEAGFALMWAVALLIFTSILSVAMYYFVMSNSKQVINQSVEMSTFYVAESGIELANAFLANKIPVNKNKLKLANNYYISGTYYSKTDLLTKISEKDNENITILDVIGSSTDTLYLGDDPDASSDSLKLFIPNKKEAIGEVYVTIARENGFGTDWVVIKSTGTYYVSANEKKSKTTVVRIDVNNHGHVKREYFDGKQ